MVEVVAALIWDENRFMICQRPEHKARGLLWEFVGGKVEAGETNIVPVPCGRSRIRSSGSWRHRSFPLHHKHGAFGNVWRSGRAWCSLCYSFTYLTGNHSDSFRFRFVCIRGYKEVGGTCFELRISKRTRQYETSNHPSSEGAPLQYHS